MQTYLIEVAVSGGGAFLAASSIALCASRIKADMRRRKAARTSSNRASQEDGVAGSGPTQS